VFTAPAIVFGKRPLADVSSVASSAAQAFVTTDIVPSALGARRDSAMLSPGTDIGLSRLPPVRNNWERKAHMKSLSRTLAIAGVGASILAFSAVSASAEIACNGDVCWHVKDRYEYPPTAKIIIHPDDWKWEPSEHYSWREHEGRGYWRGDRWTEW
jgi:hypothetical protein